MDPALNTQAEPQIRSEDQWTCIWCFLRHSGGVGSAMVHTPTAERTITLRDCMTLLQREPQSNYQLQAKLEKRIIQSDRKAQWSAPR